MQKPQMQKIESSNVTKQILAALVLAFTFTAGCAHKAVMTEPAPDRVTLIPYGVHQQSVTVTVKRGPEGQELPPSAPKKMSFSGVLDHRAERTQLIGLTPFGSTLFKLIDDTKAGTLTFTTDNAQMKKAEPYLKSTYAPLRELLKLPYPPKIGAIQKGDVNFKFEKYSASEIPMRVLVETPNFDLVILEDGYEP